MLAAYPDTQPFQPLKPFGMTAEHVAQPAHFHTAPQPLDRAAVTTVTTLAHAGALAAAAGIAAVTAVMVVSAMATVQLSVAGVTVVTDEAGIAGGGGGTGAVQYVDGGVEVGGLVTVLSSSGGVTGNGQYTDGNGHGTECNDQYNGQGTGDNGRDDGVSGWDVLEARVWRICV